MDLADELLNDFGTDECLVDDISGEDTKLSIGEVPVEKSHQDPKPQDSTTPSVLRDVHGFLESTEFKRQYALIDSYCKLDVKIIKEDDMPIQSSPLHGKVLLANNMVQVLDEQFYKLYQYIVDNYSKKVKDLRDIFPNPYDYIKVLSILKHDTFVEGKNLEHVVPAQQIMTLSVALTGASSGALSDTQMGYILNGCEVCLTLMDFREKIVSCIELFMGELAPNLSKLVGTEIAANLVALAGGMISLSRIPACNVVSIGKKEKILNGFSKLNEVLHVGILGQHSLIVSTPTKHKQKAAKILAGKVVLACRVDCTRGSRGGDVGAKLLENVKGKIEMWQQMNKSKMHRPLPIPGAQKSKKRGGKRYRKHKQKYGLTDTHRERKRIKFAGQDDEYGDSAMGLTNGTLGMSDNGRLRLTHGSSKS
eukprot:g9533.t1